MLPCIARSKHQSDDHHHPPPDSSHKSHLAKSLSYQFKKMALRASGAYRNCNTCTGATTLPHPKHKYRNDAVTDSIAASASNRFKRSTSCSVSATTGFGGFDGDERVDCNLIDDSIPKIKKMRENVI